MLLGSITADKFDAVHFEASAKSGENIEYIFETCILKIVNAKEEKQLKISVVQEKEVKKCELCNIL